MLGNMVSDIGLVRPLLINIGGQTVMPHRSQRCFVSSEDRLIDVVLVGVHLGLTTTRCASEEFNVVPLG